MQTLFNEPDLNSISKGSMWISELCLLSYPCQHRVIIRDQNDQITRKNMDACEIYRWHIQNGITVPSHFNYVAKMI